jgi:hypothetical protein
MLNLANQKNFLDLKFVHQVLLVARIYTVLRYVEQTYFASNSFNIPLIIFFLNRNSIQKQVLPSLVVVLDLVKLWTKISSAMLRIIYVATKIYATIIRLVFVPKQHSSIDWKELNYKCARAVSLCEHFLFASFILSRNK